MPDENDFICEVSKLALQILLSKSFLSMRSISSLQIEPASKLLWKVIVLAKSQVAQARSTAKLSFYQL